LGWLIPFNRHGDAQIPLFERGESSMKRLAFTILWSTILFVGASSAETRRIRVLLLDGQSAGAYHNWQLTTPVLKKELEDSGRFRVTVATSPQSGGDFSGFRPEFDNYQVIVLNYDAPDWPADLRLQFENYIETGGGLVIVHAADNAFPYCRPSIRWPESAAGGAETKTQGLSGTSRTASWSLTPLQDLPVRMAIASLSRSRRACRNTQL
jgi:hypothetical protein